jgi:hypothetical protein
MIRGGQFFVDSCNLSVICNTYNQKIVFFYIELIRGELMKLLSKSGLFAVGAVLSACSSTTTSTPTPPATPATTDIGGQATHVGSTYSATQAGALTAIPSAAGSSNGQPFWMNTGAGIAIYGYESSNVLALGGINSNTLIKGVTGVLSSPAQTGTATYSGRYSVVTKHLSGSGIGSASTGLMSYYVDFGAGTLAGSIGSGVVANANINGQQFTGTFTYNGTSAPLEGGFFGTNEMAGAFGNASIAGVIYGTK